MAVRPANEAGARQRALEVLEECGVDQAPVVPEQIAAAFPLPLPIETSSKFPPSAYGALFKFGNDFRIVLASTCPTEGHRRFTLAHELGHFHLDGHLDVLFDRGVNVHMSNDDHFRGLRRPWFEIEADAFASELLMPGPHAARIVAGGGGGLTIVEAIADTFQTSLSAAAIRYAALTDDAAIVVVTYDATIEWISFAPRCDEHWWARRRLKGEWVPRNSGTGRLAADAARIAKSDRVSDRGLLSDWFDKAPAIEVLEDAIGLGTYGRVLTVLNCPTLPTVDALREREERAARRDEDYRRTLSGWSWDDPEDYDD